MEEDFIKTGEDKNFEYYRNDSEVLSSDGEEELYEEILNKKEEFTVKIDDKELIIQKRTLYRIMILSDSQPEEQILFSHYKTVKQSKSNDKKKTQTLSNQNLQSKNPENLNKVPPTISYKSIDEPLSEKNDNVLIQFNNPTPDVNNNNKNNNNYENENIMFKKTENSDNLLMVGLPPEAVKIKWFYLLLVLCGIINVIYFFYCLFGIKFLFNSFLIMLFGIVQILTGVIGHSKINKKIYDDKMLYILTLVCAILPIVSFLLILMAKTTRSHIVFELIVHAIAITFAILCLVFTGQLKKKENSTKSRQMEQLL